MPTQAALIYGLDFHHLDHLGPLASILGIPLLVTEEETEREALAFYPNLKVLKIPPLQMGGFLVENFDLILTTLPRDLFDGLFFFEQSLKRKKVATLFCPHGNSDKGHLSPYMEGLSKEKGILVYGKKMLDFLKEKQILEKIKWRLIIGNYRYLFFKKYHSFYQNLVENKVFSRFDKKQKTVLYAPTWDDSENSSSFFKIFPHLVKGVPSHINLLIKIHPNLEKMHPFLIDEAKECSCSNVLFLTGFSPIYPLLERVDYYLGDFSSIGYDYLTFDKPLFFFNVDKRDPGSKGLYLHRCGTVIPKDHYTDIFSILETTSDSFSRLRQEIYHYTFSEVSLEALKQRIELIYEILVDEGMMFY